MRVDLLVLFTSCALLVCASDASNVRGSNPITPSDMSAIVQPVSDSQQDIPEKRLLRTNKSINDEERTPLDLVFRDHLLNRVVTLGNGSRATASEALQKSKDIERLLKVYTPKELLALMSLRLGETSLGIALLEALVAGEAGPLKPETAKHLTKAYFGHWRNAQFEVDPVERAYEILMDTRDFREPFSMSIEGIEAMERIIKYHHKTDDKFFVVRTLFSTLYKKAGERYTVLSTISRHHDQESGAKLLEEKLYDLLSKGGEEGVVKKLFEEGYLKELGPSLLTSYALNMLKRFYVKSSKSDGMSDVTAKVMALRKGIGNDEQVASLISKAKNEENKRLQDAAALFEAEFLRQLKAETTP